LPNRPTFLIAVLACSLLPTVLPAQSGQRDKEMLKALESNPSLDRRTEAARYFLEEHGRAGKKALLVLLDESVGAQLHKAVLIALARFGGPTASSDFSKRFDNEPVGRRLEILKMLERDEGKPLEKLRKKLVRAPYLPLRGEALRQLALRRDRSAISVARRLAQKKDGEQIASVLFEILIEIGSPRDVYLCARLLARPDPRMVAAMERALPKLRAKEEIRDWVFTVGLKHRDLATRRFALRILEGLKGPKVPDALFEVVRSKDDFLRRAALLALAGSKDQRLRPVLIELLGKGNDREQLDALEALEDYAPGGPLLRALALKLAKEGRADVRVFAVATAARLRLTELLPEVPALCRSSDWRLRSATYFYAAVVRSKDSIAPLIDALPREKGRLARELRLALNGLTRLYFMRTIDWQRWWGRGEGELPPSSSGEDGEEEGRCKGRHEERLLWHPGRLRARCVLSRHQWEHGGTRWHRGRTRMDIARRALLKALGDARPGTFANVLFFDIEVHAYAKKLVELAKSDHLKKLEGFIKAAKPLGGTNLHAAIFQAMADPKVDTVFLLSDGDPSTGKILDPLELADAVLQANRSRRVVFHGIAVGGESVLLKKLAEASGGQYVRG